MCGRRDIEQSSTVMLQPGRLQRMAEPIKLKKDVECPAWYPVLQPAYREGSTKGKTQTDREIIRQWFFTEQCEN